MTRRQLIYDKIEKERLYQDEKWGSSFDDKNTPNDWVSCIVMYVGKAVLMPFNKELFHSALLKVAALCVAALERDEYPKRHYDK